MRVTFVYMVLCGGGEPTVLQVSRGILRRGAFRPTVDVCKVSLPAGQRLAFDGSTHKAIAKEYATAEYPSFWERGKVLRICDK